MHDSPPKIVEATTELLAWVHASGAEGAALLRREAAWNSLIANIGFVDGNQLPLRSSALSRITDNRAKKVLYETVSAMTDVRPIWNYQTENNKWKEQASVLNLLVRNWWRNTYADMALQDCLMYAGVGGSGYIKLEWDPSLPGGGNIVMIPLDPRDVIPIRPAYNSSVQKWEGVQIRKVITVNEARRRWPGYAHRLSGTTASWFEPKGFPSPAGNQRNVVSPAMSVLFPQKPPEGTSVQNIDLIHIFVKDYTINVSSQSKLMGKPNSNWSYWVHPVGSTHPITNKIVTEEEARLYPRGRLIICTPDCILEDMPNPYWHGQFPLIKFTLDATPWSILGTPLISDIKSMCEALNEGLRGFDDGMRQWIRPNVVADKNAVPQSVLKNYEPRKGGQRLSMNPSAGKGMEHMPGPNLPPFYGNFLQFLREEIDDNAGVKGLRELAQLKQMPSSETVEKFLDSQSPLLKLRGRNLERSLAELAEMVKVMMFQFYDTPRRVQILGPKGAMKEDFYDYDPGTMIPGMAPGSAEFRAEYDARLDRLERGIAHSRNFTFTVEPNSFLETSHMQHKMFLLQLYRMPMPLVDPWTLLEAFDVPGIGPVPEGTVFDRIKLAQMLGLMPGPPPPPGAGGPAPGGPPPGPPGRPPSGQAPPKFVTRTDEQTGGQRQVVSESGR